VGTAYALQAMIRVALPFVTAGVKIMEFRVPFVYPLRTLQILDLQVMHGYFEKKLYIKKMKYWVSANDIGKEGKFFRVFIVDETDDIFTVNLGGDEEDEYYLMGSQIISTVEFIALYDSESFEFEVNTKAFQSKSDKETNIIIRSKLIEKLQKTSESPAMLARLSRGAPISEFSTAFILQSKEENIIMVEDDSKKSLSSSAGLSAPLSLLSAPIKVVESIVNGSQGLVAEVPNVVSSALNVLTTGLNLPARRIAAALNGAERMSAQAPSDIAHLLTIPSSVFETFNPEALVSRLAPKYLRVKIDRHYGGGGYYNYIVRDETGKEFAVYTDQLLPVGSYDEAEKFYLRAQQEETFLEKALKQIEKLAHVPASLISSAGGGGGRL
jgi:hypothetical protein